MTVRWCRGSLTFWSLNPFILLDVIEGQERGQTGEEESQEQSGAFSRVAPQAASCGRPLPISACVFDRLCKSDPCPRLAGLVLNQRLVSDCMCYTVDFTGKSVR